MTCDGFVARSRDNRDHRASTLLPALHPVQHDNPSLEYLQRVFTKNEIRGIFECYNDGE